MKVSVYRAGERQILTVPVQFFRSGCLIKVLVYSEL